MGCKVKKPQGSMSNETRGRSIVIGAGIGGLACAIDLARHGLDVVVLEKAARPGGKMRQDIVTGRGIDAGPTVLTMRQVFEELFRDAGEDLGDHVRTRPLDVIARHAWPDGSRLDLFADCRRSADAIAEMAGAEAGRGFLRFCEASADIYRTLEDSFIRAPRPDPLTLTRRVGLSNLAGLWRIRPFATMWSALGEFFPDPRLRQLFGRYATYCGSSPFEAPATLMLVAHVEQAGVWRVEGGMYGLAEALAGLAGRLGVEIRYGAEVTGIEMVAGRAAGVSLAGGETVRGGTVVVNADPAAVAGGLLGEAAARSLAGEGGDRSLSAITWSMVTDVEGIDLAHHNVLFSSDYRAEFEGLFRQGRVPAEPTVYLCAQADAHAPADRPQPLLCLINAPANGDACSYDQAEIERCADRTFRLMARCGLHVTRPQTTTVTTPADFNRMFPGTGGALYGRASHGWQASFRRPGSRTRLPGLYLAGGGTHPGPGVPMAALSGRLAASSMVADLASMRSFHPVAMCGGTSTR